MILIDSSNPTPYYQQISNQIISDIETGLLREGERLPSIRTQAQKLGVSRNTVERAYLQLMQEGYAEGRPNSGYFVNKLRNPVRTMRASSAEQEVQLERLMEHQARIHAKNPEPRYDFAYDAMDPSVFPYTKWTRVLRDVLAGPSGKDICKYHDPQGLFELREQIATYLAREEDIVAVPEQILILPTTRNLVLSILNIFSPESTVVLTDNPSYPEVFNSCRETGYTTIGHPIFPHYSWKEFSERELATMEGKTKLIYTTPADQYPTNAELSFEERKALVAWAAENDGYIIEDEYCHEFRYGTHHLPSLNALDDNDRVITIGTFSKSFAPSVCMSYAVLPPKLMVKWLRPSNISHGMVPWHTQAAMAQFMKEGLWYTHLHKVQTAYCRKQEKVLDAIERHMGDAVNILQAEVGLHLLIAPKDNRSEVELIEQAARLGVKVYPTSQDWIGRVPKNWNFVLLGYASIAAADIDAGIEALAKAWF